MGNYRGPQPGVLFYHVLPLIPHLDQLTHFKQVRLALAMAPELNREAEGLQVVPNNAPEVVAPRYSSLEVAPLEDSAPQTRYGHSSEDFPNGDNKSQGDPWPESHESKGMIGSAASVNNEEGHSAGTKKGRMCGLRRLHFWLLAVLLLVVVLAAVLGGVFGSRASHSDSS